LGERKDADYYRNQERLDVYRRLPLVFLCFLVSVWVIYINSFSENLVLQETKIIGPAKYIWALTVETLVGLTFIFGVSSLSFLFWIGAATKSGDFIPHPWKPIIISCSLLVASFGLCLLAYYVEFAVVDNVKNINTNLRFQDTQYQNAFEVLGVLLWMIVTSVIGYSFAFILYEILKAPFNAREALTKMHENNDERR
jgi:hypothetical protein